MDSPFSDDFERGLDDFDRDITKPHDELFEPEDYDYMVMYFIEMRETFEALVEAGFSEAQALRYCAFCSICLGDR